MPESTREALLVTENLVYFDAESMFGAGLVGAVNIVVEDSTGNVRVRKQLNGSLGDRADPTGWNDVARKRGAHEPTLPIRLGCGRVKD
jgi:hypothetical protein